MASADIKVIAKGQWSETISVRDVSPGNAVLVRVDDAGLVVVETLSANDAGIAALVRTVVDQKDPGIVE